MIIKFIWALFFIILGILSVLKAFQIQKKSYKYISIFGYILYGLIFILPAGLQSWEKIIEDWQFLLLMFTIFLIVSLLISIFKSYTMSVYLEDEKIIVDAIIQTLTDDNYDYNYEEEFGIIVFSINKYKKIRLTPVTKFFKDEVKCYNITYTLFKKKQFENLHEKIYNKLNITNDNKRKKKDFYLNIILAVIFFCFSILSIVLI